MICVLNHSTTLHTSILQVHSLQTMQVLHGMRFGSPLMSLAVSSDNRKMVVGFVDGSLMVRTRNLEGDGALGSSSSGAVKNRRQGMFYKGEGIGNV
jgi:hypothetical protein